MANVAKLRDSIKSKSAAEIKSGKIQILAEIMRLRQLCCDPALLYDGYSAGSAKVEMCIDLIRRATDGGHKILLFSQFTGMLDIRRRDSMRKISGIFLWSGLRLRNEESA